MKLLELKNQAKKLTYKPNMSDRKVLHIVSKKKGKKAIAEFIEHCNARGFVPVNPHERWSDQKKGTDVYAIGIFFGDAEEAKKIKVIESDTKRN